MKNLKEIIEGLKVNSKSKLSKEINEDVLVLEADTNQNYTFDLKLFLHVLEKLNEEYKNPFFRLPCISLSRHPLRRSGFLPYCYDHYRSGCIRQ